VQKEIDGIQKANAQS